MNNMLFKPRRIIASSLVCFSVLLSGCDSDDSSSDDGYVKFYNASSNSPAMYLTVDEDLSSDSSDEIETTFSAVSFGSALSTQDLPSQKYYYELAWQDDEDDSSREDLAIVAEDQLTVKANEITLLVMYGDVQSPYVAQYEIDKIDDQDDTDNDLFNLRFLNASNDEQTLDVYMSKSNQTFNEASYMGTVAHLELTDNTKLDEDDYIFYLTQAGQTDVLFESTVVEYPYSSQYMIVIRNDSNVGGSEYVIDNVGNSSVSTYQDSNAVSHFRIYNGVQQSDIMPEYTGELNITFDSLGDEEIAPINNLQSGEFSTVRTIENGDFSVDISDATTEEYLINRQLISLEENANKTIFYYSMEVAIDEDGDGDVDEDGDGQIDEKELQVKSVMIENSTRDRIYDHEVEILSLSYSEEFSQVNFYFVQSDETISTASNIKRTTLGNPVSLELNNNTYDVFAITDIDGRETILDSMVLTLDEESQELFMLLEANESMPSGYEIRVLNQTSDN